MFSSPCNPSGSVYSKNELEDLKNVLVNYPNIFVIADEIYELINFGEKHFSIACFKDLYNQVITVNGVSKGFAMTGWRIGYIGAPLWLAKAVIKMQGQITSAASSIAQKAAQAAVEADPKVMSGMRDEFLKRRDMMLEKLNEIEGIRCSIPKGAFYLFPDVQHFFGKSFNGKRIENADDLCMYLLQEARIALVTGSAFGNPECIRLSYAASNDDLIEAASRLKKALEQLQ
jgi:aspartate aminotransferase